MGTAQPRQPGVDHPDYLPRVLPIAGRIAAYTANLVVLAVAVRGRWEVPDPHLHEWQALALLWQSQLGAEEWARLIEALDIERLRVDGRSTVAVVLREGQPPSPVDMAWLFELDPDSRGADLPPLLDEFRRWENSRPSHPCQGQGGYGPVARTGDPVRVEGRSGAGVVDRLRVAADQEDRVARRSAVDLIAYAFSVAEVLADLSLVAEVLTCFTEIGLDVELVNVFRNISDRFGDAEVNAIAESDRQLFVRLKRALASIGQGGHMAR